MPRRAGRRRIFKRILARQQREEATRRAEEGNKENREETPSWSLTPLETYAINPRIYANALPNDPRRRLVPPKPRPRIISNVQLRPPRLPSSPPTIRIPTPPREKIVVPPSSPAWVRLPEPLMSPPPPPISPLALSPLGFEPALTAPLIEPPSHGAHEEIESPSFEPLTPVKAVGEGPVVTTGLRNRWMKSKARLDLSSLSIPRI